VEGYVESAASGLMAGINAALLLKGRPPVVWPAETAHGALTHYITSTDARHFQPMNVTFGLFPPLEEKVRDKRQRYAMYASRALEKLQQCQALLL